VALGRLCSAAPLFAADDPQLWTGASATVKLAERWRLSEEVTTPFQRATGFDRVRNLVAISTPVSRNVTAEIGYLNQYTAVRQGPDSDDHVASVSLSTSF
jgi:hypothetical protein